MKREILNTVEHWYQWATRHGVITKDVEVVATPYGNGLRSRSSFTEPEEIILNVPRDLVLNIDYVHARAKSDNYLAVVLDAVGEFGQTDRGAILIYLLIEIARTSPDMLGWRGANITTPWTEYVQLIPSEEGLPTFWNDSERHYLKGTSLEAATSAKLNTLTREFRCLYEATKDIGWCTNYWWGEKSCLTLDDWKIVDSMYRSRAMDLPGYGHCLVPVADICNHASSASNTARTALEETSETPSVVLRTDSEKLKQPGTEVTISYGDGKGASEMIFSYGFIDQDMDYAESIFLGLPADEDDPLFQAKEALFICAPGFRIHSQMTSTNNDWEGLYVWLFCVNQEDGLEFEVTKNAEGQKDLHATFKGKPLRNALDLYKALKRDRSWELFQLRAYAKVQERIQQELDAREALLYDRESNAWPAIDPSSSVYKNTERLRELEADMLEDCSKQFQDNIRYFYNTETVVRYFEAGPDAHVARVKYETEENIKNISIREEEELSDGSWSNP